jgi:hypothetical protein
LKFVILHLQHFGESKDFYQTIMFTIVDGCLLSLFIGDVDIFPLIPHGDIVNINELTLILKIISQCYDNNKNNNISIEGLTIHYH